MDGKKWYMSKTIWVQVVAFLAVALGALNVIEVDAESQALTVAAIMAVINVVVRFMTKGPIV